MNGAGWACGRVWNGDSREGFSRAGERTGAGNLGVGSHGVGGIGVGTGSKQFSLVEGEWTG